MSFVDKERLHDHFASKIVVANLKLKVFDFFIYQAKKLSVV